MQIFLILALLIAILAVIFAVQNVAVVSISFFAWNAHVSLAVALLAALGAGVLITLLVSIPGEIKSRWNTVSHKKKASSLETERNSLKLKVDEALSGRDSYQKKLEASEKEVSDLEEQLASLSAALQEAGKQPGLTMAPGLPQPTSWLTMPPNVSPTDGAPDESKTDSLSAGR